MTAPRVSVVIPTFNHAHFLKSALESVRAQSMADWECIVVNNYSTDDTESVIAILNDSRIRLINFNNEGIIAASRNVGIAEARGEWIAFLDSDDLWDQEKLDSCLAVANDEVDVIAHPERYLQDGVSIRESEVARPERVSYRALLFRGNCLSPSGTLVRRTWLQRLNGFSVDRELVTAEDFDLWLRLAASGARFVAVERTLGSFRLHAAQNSSAAERHEAASLSVLDRHLGTLHGRSWLDRVRGRRAKALVIYAAGRTLQKASDHVGALRKFVKAVSLFPFIPKIWIFLVAVAFRRG